MPEPARDWRAGSSLSPEMCGRLLCSVILNLLLVALASAQSITASISGVVKDDFGRPVADATVTVTDQELKAITSSKTDAAGHYLIDNLPIGKYKLTIESEGLKSESITDINLHVAEEVSYDLTMQLNVEGKAIKKFSPSYPEPAKLLRKEGRVVVRVLIKPDGTVEKAIFLKGDAVFKSAALEAAKRWIFQKTNSGFSGVIAFDFKFD